MSDDLSGFSLMDLFRAEAETHTASLSAGLLALERGEPAGPETIEPMMRAAHSLKGAARIVGLDAAVRVAHALEDCFVAAQEGRCVLLPAQVDVLLRGVDLLARIASEPESVPADDAAVESLVADIVAIQNSVPPPPVEAETPSQQGARPSDQELTAATVGETGTVENHAVRDASSPAIPSPVPPAPITASAPGPAPSETAERVVRVTADSLTRLMSLAGESLVQSRQLRPFVDALLSLKGQQAALLGALDAIQGRGGGRVVVGVAPEGELLNRARSLGNHCSQALGERIEQFEDFARRVEDLAGRLHHEVLTSRMRPLADGVRGFPRMVRDVARGMGKQVRFEVVGESTGVDRDVLEKLEAPLNHLLRNSLDHGIETPEERAAAGKSPVGVIRLEARHRAGMLHLTLSDDGRGVDPERVRAKIVERGLASAPMAAQLSEGELLEFLFLPGFSTRHEVTELSGRGVGLDVVHTMVRGIGGVVRVGSQVGKGTRFTLQLPVTMSVIRALLVRVAGEPYAFPLNRIDRIVMLSERDVQVLEGRQHFMSDGGPVGLVEASQVLELPPGEREEGVYPVVVASDRSHRFGVVVDAFLGERDIEVRPLDPRLGKVPNINSASVLEDGRPVLIFDVEDLVRSVDNLLSGRRLTRLRGPAERVEVRGPRRVLVVDDSLTVRELERQLLENAGYSVEVAVDGVDGWNAVRAGAYDLVVSDVDMPRMDGIRLVTMIKQDPRLRHVPVVIVSYKDREEDRMRGLDAGANAYLTKSSFHDRTFVQTVADLIGEAAG